MTSNRLLIELLRHMPPHVVLSSVTHRYAYRLFVDCVRYALRTLRQSGLLNKKDTSGTLLHLWIAPASCADDDAQLAFSSSRVSVALPGRSRVQFREFQMDARVGWVVWHHFWASYLDKRRFGETNDALWILPSRLELTFRRLRSMPCDCFDAPSPNTLLAFWDCLFSQHAFANMRTAVEFPAHALEKTREHVRAHTSGTFFCHDDDDNGDGERALFEELKRELLHNAVSALASYPADQLRKTRQVVVNMNRLASRHTGHPLATVFSPAYDSVWNARLTQFALCVGFSMSLLHDHTSTATHDTHMSANVYFDKFAHVHAHLYEAVRVREEFLDDTLIDYARLARNMELDASDSATLAVLRKRVEQTAFFRDSTNLNDDILLLGGNLLTDVMKPTTCQVSNIVGRSQLVWGKRPTTLIRAYEFVPWERTLADASIRILNPPLTVAAACERASAVVGEFAQQRLVSIAADPADWFVFDASAINIDDPLALNSSMLATGMPDEHFFVTYNLREPTRDILLWVRRRSWRIHNAHGLGLFLTTVENVKRTAERPRMYVAKRRTPGVGAVLFNAFFVNPSPGIAGRTFAVWARLSVGQSTVYFNDVETHTSPHIAYQYVDRLSLVCDTFRIKTTDSSDANPFWAFLRLALPTTTPAIYLRKRDINVLLRIVRSIDGNPPELLLKPLLAALPVALSDDFDNDDDDDDDDDDDTDDVCTECGVSLNACSAWRSRADIQSSFVGVRNTNAVVCCHCYLMFCVDAPPDEHFDEDAFGVQSQFGAGVVRRPVFSSPHVEPFLTFQSNARACTTCADAHTSASAACVDDDDTILRVSNTNHQFHWLIGDCLLSCFRFLREHNMEPQLRTSILDCARHVWFSKPANGVGSPRLRDAPHRTGVKRSSPSSTLPSSALPSAPSDLLDNNFADIPTLLQSSAVQQLFRTLSLWDPCMLTLGRSDVDGLAFEPPKVCSRNLLRRLPLCASGLNGSCDASVGQTLTSTHNGVLVERLSDASPSNLFLSALTTK